MALRALVVAVADHLDAGDEQNAPNTGSIHQNRVMSALPPRMKTARSVSAPKMPQKSTRCWYRAGIAKVEEDDRPDEDVVDAERLLDDVPAEVLAERLTAPREEYDDRRTQDHRPPRPADSTRAR